MRIEDFVADFLRAQEENPAIYEPREDSFLMLEALSDLDLEGERVLDMGAGSGILALYCARRRAAVTASDIDPAVVRALKNLAERLRIRIKVVVSDLFSKIDGRFDMVVFNPPYLPSDRVEDRTVDGGNEGSETIRRFMNELGQHLTDNGFAVVLVSSLNKPEDLVRDQPDMTLEVIRHRQLFFETLYVVKVMLRTKANLCSLMGGRTAT